MRTPRDPDAITIDRPFAIFVQPADDLEGVWIAHVVGHNLDNVTQGEGPEDAVEMAADLLRCLTDRCPSPDGHDYSVEAVMPDSWDANGDPTWRAALKCAFCDFRIPK